MKGFLRTLEAVIAISLLFVMLTRVLITDAPEFEGEASLESGAVSVLSKYRSTFSKYSFSDPSLLFEFLPSVLPEGQNYYVEIKYFQPVDALYNSNLTDVPLEFYVDAPSGVDSNSLKLIQNEEFIPFQVERNWYRIPFFVRNDGIEREDYEAVVNFAVFEKDTNSDGVLEPVDPDSIMIYLNGTEYGYTLNSWYARETYHLVSVNLDIDYLGPEEELTGYLYYLVGDSY